jgi:4a-hydroxytetrahydrobiopterin dehydratase
MTRAKLTEEEIAAGLGQLGSGWTVAGGKLHRELRFSGFVEAFGFMTGVALIAQRMDHHPDWSNVWNRVVIDLVTHDAGGITAKDLALAVEIERLAARLL